VIGRRRVGGKRSLTDRQAVARVVQAITLVSGALALVGQASSMLEDTRTYVDITFVAVANLAVAAPDWASELRQGSP
jgi:hypothetical protein